jgi:hypothetical protein
MTERKRREVSFDGNTVTLDGAQYTLEGVASATVWTLALEGLVARLKRTKEPAEVYRFIATDGIAPVRKKNQWAEALASATEMTYPDALAVWESASKEKRTQFRNHPDVYAAYHNRAGSLDDLVKK